MHRFSIYVLPFVFSLFCLVANAELEEEVKQGLLQFMEKLSPGDIKYDPNFGWNSTSDPCNDKWLGVHCDDQTQSVTFLFLDRLQLSGTLDAASLCKATTSLVLLSVVNNNLRGVLPSEISNCRNLTHLQIRMNNFSGPIPASISEMTNLKSLLASYNNFTGEIPEFSGMSNLINFIANDNHLSGEIPEFNLSKLSNFNVSNNDLSGPIPDFDDRFDATSFSGNPSLCGKPLPNACP